MMQEIDFLKNFPKRSNQLPAIYIGLIILLILFLCILASSTLAYYQMVANDELRAAQVLKQKVQNEYQRYVEKYPLLMSDKPLVEMVGEFEKRLREKQIDFAKLSHETMRRPFSHYLEALTRTVPKGLWLTEIDIDQNQDSVNLRGFSLQPVLISTLLQELQSSPGFKGVNFDLFYLNKVKDKNYLQFEIANKQLSEETITEYTATKNSEAPSAGSQQSTGKQP